MDEWKSIGTVKMTCFIAIYSDMQKAIFLCLFKNFVVRQFGEVVSI